MRLKKKWKSLPSQQSLSTWTVSQQRTGLRVKNHFYHLNTNQEGNSPQVTPWCSEWRKRQSPGGSQQSHPVQQGNQPVQQKTVDSLWPTVIMPPTARMRPVAPGQMFHCQEMALQDHLPEIPLRSCVILCKPQILCPYWKVGTSLFLVSCFRQG